MPLRALLVEDSRSEAALVGRLLRMAAAPRFDVILVHRLADALAVLATRRMDLVLLDLGLPDVTEELEGLREIRRQFPDTPTVILTGAEASADLQAAVEADGGAACLFKQGLTPAALHGALQAAVRRTGSLIS